MIWNWTRLLSVLLVIFGLAACDNDGVITGERTDTVRSSTSSPIPTSTTVPTQTYQSTSTPHDVIVVTATATPVSTVSPSPTPEPTVATGIEPNLSEIYNINLCPAKNGNKGRVIFAEDADIDGLSTFASASFYDAKNIKEAIYNHLSQQTNNAGLGIPTDPFGFFPDYSYEICLRRNADLSNLREGVHAFIPVNIDPQTIENRCAHGLTNADLFKTSIYRDTVQTSMSSNDLFISLLENEGLAPARCYGVTSENNFSESSAIAAFISDLISDGGIPIDSTEVRLDAGTQISLYVEPSINTQKAEDTVFLACSDDPPSFALPVEDPKCYHSFLFDGVHPGLDFYIQAGEPVFSVVSGTVVFNETTQVGGMLAIDAGCYTLGEQQYQIVANLNHATMLSSIDVGDWVEQGQQVGSGNHYLEVELQAIFVAPGTNLSTDHSWFNSAGNRFDPWEGTVDCSFSHPYD